MTDQVLDELRTVIDATAGTFDRRASQIKERELEMAVECAARAIGCDLSRQFALRLEHAWFGRVGGVDLALRAADGSIILIELKWDSVSLAACAWDSIKLAAALEAGEAQRAFLVAGSPDYVVGLRGDELLEDGELEPVALRRKYANEFDYWKTQVKNHPLRAPRSWRVQARHYASLDYKEAPWRLRVAEIEVTNSELLSVE